MKKPSSANQSVASIEPVNKQFTIWLLTGMLMLYGLLLPNTAYLGGKPNPKTDPIQIDNRIRKLDQSGVINKVAGNGSGEGRGDGGLAINAALHLPEGIAVDSVGNLFIADTYNGSIRKVATSGKISTVAGNGN